MTSWFEVMFKNVSKWIFAQRKEHHDVTTQATTVMSSILPPGILRSGMESGPIISWSPKLEVMTVMNNKHVDQNDSNHQQQWISSSVGWFEIQDTQSSDMQVEGQSEFLSHIQYRSHEENLVISFYLRVFHVKFPCWLMDCKDSRDLGMTNPILQWLSQVETIEPVHVWVPYVGGCL